MLVGTLEQRLNCRLVRDPEPYELTPAQVGVLLQPRREEGLTASEGAPSELPAEPRASEFPAEPRASEFPAEPRASEFPAEPRASEFPAEPRASEIVHRLKQARPMARKRDGPDWRRVKIWLTARGEAWCNTFPPLWTRWSESFSETSIARRKRHCADC
jgi:hypothetical protein